MDLTVEVAGLTLKNPVIAAAGPNSKDVNVVEKAFKAGASAVVVRCLHLTKVGEKRVPYRSIFEIYHPEQAFEGGYYSFQSGGGPATRVCSGVPPGLGGAARVPSLEEWTEEVKKMSAIAKKYDGIIIGSIGWCGKSQAPQELWEAEARVMKEAGADAIELHTSPSPPAECARYLQLDPEKYLVTPIKISKKTGLPVFAKIGVDCCDTIEAAKIAQKAGADAVVPVTRWFSIKVDTESGKGEALGPAGLGGPWSVPIMCGLLFRMRREMIPGPIIPSGGITSGSDVIRYLLLGADATQMCAQILVEGYGAVKRILKETEQWMGKNGYDNVDQFKGAVKFSPWTSIPQWIPNVDEATCNGCGRCIVACSNEAISMTEGTANINIEKCEGCGACYFVCPTNAITRKA